ncbi:hypothetical protein FHX57_006731 [Paraburkholderia tropica]|uniref:hypothetical protein n=1 Tax=Paraburkholderia tropica TaxID=92647 RepID=UPI001612DA1C|nr:hypothetical protein [Paraburkholderia tropica]MBB3004349.1 hypothetical protein [Paraburkholderia tropica]
MATNDFLPFAVGSSANVLSQSAYAALTSVLQNGFQSGIAQSVQLNKVWRQSSIMAAVLAQFIADQSGQNSVDDGTTATLETNLISAIRNAAKQTVILTDTGAANAYTATNTPALTILPGTGYTQRVNIAHANTGASTYAPDGLAAKPIYGLGLQPLQGGELPVGVVILMYLVQAGVNSGNGAWIIIESLGGALQVAPATASQHAVQLQQVGHGQCRLSVSSTTTLVLKPHNGNNVIVNGVPLQLPAAGVTYTASGLTANTLYYVYLGGTTAAPTLSLSTTGHGTASNGVETMTGNTALTLVGMVFVNASLQFTDTSASPLCLNWFQRRRKLIGSAGSSATTTSTSLAQLTGPAITFISWGDEALDATLNGVASNSTAGATANLALAIDSSTSASTQSTMTSTSANQVQTVTSHGAQAAGALAEGAHTLWAYGFVSSGTGSFNSVIQATTGG